MLQILRYHLELYTTRSWNNNYTRLLSGNQEFIKTLRKIAELERFKTGNNIHYDFEKRMKFPRNLLALCDTRHTIENIFLHDSIPSDFNYELFGAYNLIFSKINNPATNSTQDYLIPVCIDSIDFIPSSKTLKLVFNFFNQCDDNKISFSQFFKVQSLFDDCINKFIKSNLPVGKYTFYNLKNYLYYNRNLKSNPIIKDFDCNPFEIVETFQISIIDQDGKVWDLSYDTDLIKDSNTSLFGLKAINLKNITIMNDLEIGDLFKKLEEYNNGIMDKKQGEITKEISDLNISDLLSKI